LIYVITARGMGLFLKDGDTEVDHDPNNRWATSGGIFPQLLAGIRVLVQAKPAWLLSRERRALQASAMPDWLPDAIWTAANVFKVG